MTKSDKRSGLVPSIFENFPSYIFILPVNCFPSHFRPFSPICGFFAFLDRLPSNQLSLLSFQSLSPPLGLIFANFMLCSFAGAASFHVVTRLHFSLASRFDFRCYHALVLAVGVALLAFIPLAINAHAKVTAPVVTLAAFMTLQFAAGL